MECNQEIRLEAGAKHFITGATGEIGIRVVKLLLSRGYRPRILARDKEKAERFYGDSVGIAIGDLDDEASVRQALTGGETVFLLNTGPDLARRDEMVARAGRNAGVRRIVKLSTLDVRCNVGTGVWHARGESAVRASGIPFTFVQPSGFMTNALHWASSIKAEGVVRSATGEGRIAFIHPDDIAEVIAVALLTEKYDGGSLPISGPEALSYFEMTSKIGAAIRRTLKFEAISEDEVRTQLIAEGEMPASIDYHLSIYRAIREGRMASVTDTVQRVLGRVPISFDRWANENVTAFV